ncbi:MAG: hypothetical protein HQL08_08220 [Nitrospirae bacterium]|nr:hypothetical protein [Nitrospirota bacterium]
MECTSDKFKGDCKCTYSSCGRKHKCCECLHYHRKNDELPACFFNAEYERTYDRSLENFFRMHNR